MYRLLSLTLGLSLLASPASAAIIFQYFKLTQFWGDPYVTQDVQLEMFNPAIGKLKSVSLDLELVIDRIEYYDDFAGGSFYIQSDAVTSFSVKDSEMSELLYAENQVDFRIDPREFYPPPPGPVTIHKRARSATEDSPPLLPDLSVWIGGGSRTATFYLEHHDGSEVDTRLLSAEGGVEARAVVRYFYQVPEPSTWALMIGGFGLAGAVLRRRRSLAS